MFDFGLGLVLCFLPSRLSGAGCGQDLCKLESIGQYSMYFRDSSSRSKGLTTGNLRKRLAKEGLEGSF